MTKPRLVCLPEDDLMHPNTGEGNFNESAYFNFYDPAARLGGFLRLGNRPNEHYAEMTLCLYLPDGRVAFMFKRPAIADNTKHDAGGMRFVQALRPGAWVVRIPGKPDITTTPLSLADGRPIEPLLPGGGKALEWRRLLNEAQMLLFNHPLNQAREARGEPAINSVWLWGGGCLPEKGRPTGHTVLCDHAEWRALAEYAGAKVSVLPAGWSPDVPDDALIVFDEPHRRLRQGDLSGWLQVMQGFETNWLQPLLASGRTFRLDDPLPGLSLSWRGAYRWKFWRRPKNPQRPSFDMQPPGANANTASGVDQFGNRF